MANTDTCKRVPWLFVAFQTHPRRCTFSSKTEPKIAFAKPSQAGRHLDLISTLCRPDRHRSTLELIAVSGAQPNWKNMPNPWSSPSTSDSSRRFDQQSSNNHSSVGMLGIRIVGKFSPNVFIGMMPHSGSNRRREQVRKFPSRFPFKLIE